MTPAFVCQNPEVLLTDRHHPLLQFLSFKPRHPPQRSQSPKTLCPTTTSSPLSRPELRHHPLAPVPVHQCPDHLPKARTPMTLCPTTSISPPSHPQLRHHHQSLLHGHSGAQVVRHSAARHSLPEPEARQQPRQHKHTLQLCQALAQAPAGTCGGRAGKGCSTAQEQQPGVKLRWGDAGRPATVLQLAPTAAVADAAAAGAASAAVAPPPTHTCVEGKVGVGAGCLVHL